MGSVINVNKSAYTEDALIESWSDEFVKQNMRLHREAEELDHCDGSVTERKLSDEVREKIDTIETAVKNSRTAEQRAISAEAKADAAIGTASGAVKQADAALGEAQDALAYVTTVLEGKINGAEVVAMTAQESAESAYDLASNAYDYADRKVAESKTTIGSNSRSDVSFYFHVLYNTEIRAGEIISVSFEFGDEVYAEDYTSGLSFDSGATPTAIDYTDSGILNWVGTDCATSDGLSIFQPSANTHYDIVFYFNGTQFIGLVNGFVPSTGNEAV